MLHSISLQLTARPSALSMLTLCLLSGHAITQFIFPSYQRQTILCPRLAAALHASTWSSTTARLALLLLLQLLLLLILLLLLLLLLLLSLLLLLQLLQYCHCYHCSARLTPFSVYLQQSTSLAHLASLCYVMVQASWKGLTALWLS